MTGSFDILSRGQLELYVDNSTSWFAKDVSYELEWKKINVVPSKEDLEFASLKELHFLARG